MNHNHPLITSDHLRRLAIVYIRQSTEEQVRDNTGSTDFQRSLAEVARFYGWPDCQIEIIDEDLGRSGSSSERRTGWLRMQTMIAAKQVGAVFVANISRLSRQVLDFEIFRMLAAFHNTLLYTDGRLIDPSDSNDTIVAQITAMVAHFENRKRSELMSQARMTKAKQGKAVTRLPTGWIKDPNGHYDYDPETRDAIQMIINTFWQTRSVNRTVKALAKAGFQIPTRYGRQIYLRKPTINRVRRILRNPAYAGTYVYGQMQAQPSAPVMPNGESRRINVPEERWIKFIDHHPPYMSREEQEEIKSILAKNVFRFRNRPGRGRALSQGLLRCASCGGSLSVSYQAANRYVYTCWNDYSEKPCTSFSSNEFDQFIVREVLNVLKTPPVDLLKSTLEASRSKKQTRLNWVESERERFERDERRAKERAEFTHDSLRRVHFDALEKLEKVLQEKEVFEQKIAAEPLTPKSTESEHELEALCKIASDVPSLWQHPAVTFQERKEILHCLVDKIGVSANEKQIDSIIFWKSGGQTVLKSLPRWAARHDLILQLHAQKMTSYEIREHLAAPGDSSTWQPVNITANHITRILRLRGLKTHRLSGSFIALRQQLTDLYLEGRSVEWIVEFFNDQGLTTASGKSWNSRIVYRLMRAIGVDIESYETIHYAAMTEARSRRINYRAMATEFNEKKIRRSGDQPWTARDLSKRWAQLNRQQRERKHRESARTEISEPVFLPSSA